jgi:protein involved in polysaccharide export with SLBB domain
LLMPAVYTLQSREERLSSLIRRAGGLLYTANIGGAKLIRQKKSVVDTSEVKRLLKSVAKDSSARTAESAAKNTTDVAINLKYILSHPGSADDITLEEGDELIIPRINNTVTVNGEVFKPVEVMYEKGKNINDYLSDAGGVTQSGKKGRAFVIYANGSSAQIKKPLGIFRSFPSIEPGSNIFVPEKPKKDGFDAAKAGIIISAITGLLTAAALIFR